LISRKNAGDAARLADSGQVLARRRDDAGHGPSTADLGAATT